MDKYKIVPTASLDRQASYAVHSIAAMQFVAGPFHGRGAYAKATRAKQRLVERDLVRLISNHAAEILAALDADSGWPLSVRTIATATGLSRQLVNTHLQALDEWGLVERGKANRGSRITDSGRRVLALRLKENKENGDV